MIRFDVITIFPEMVQAVLGESILKRAEEKKKARFLVHNLRDHTRDNYRKVDDRPFGGGPGMVMMPQPIFDAVKSVKGRRKAKVILTCPSGKPFNQKQARKLAKERNLIFICGHYEGVDERVRSKLVDETISIGDYVLTGGELPALVIIDAVTRLIPGVLGSEESLDSESFDHNLLDCPHYTRPAEYQKMKVPDILLSGNHAEIQKYRHHQSTLRTQKHRPDLIKKP